MKKQLFILILLVGVSLNATSQLTFQKTFKIDGGGNGYVVLQTSDGGYCAVGSTGVFGSSDVYLIKTNADGDTLWTRSYGGPGDDIGWFFQQTSDDGYIITGFATGIGAGGEDIYLIRTDLYGDTLWTKTIGGTAHDRGNCVQQTTDGGFIITGYTASFGVGSSDICLIKTDANGIITWNKIFGGVTGDLANAVEQTADGGYIITGVTNSFGFGSGDLFLIKTDLNGDTQWQNVLGDIGYDYGYSVHQTADGGYIVAGYTQSFGAGDDDFYLVKTDSIGDAMWSKTFGGTGVDRARNLQLTSDGGYILTGWTYSFSTNYSDVYIIKTDSIGDVLWTNSMGSTGSDASRSVKQTTDGGYIITGGTASFSTTTYDLYLIKVDSDGNNGCFQSFPPRFITSPTTQSMSFISVESSPAFVVDAATTNVAAGSEINVVCSNVGFDEVTGNNSYTVYPNPSAGDFVISFKESIPNGTIEIINTIGEKVYSENIMNASEMKINIENINSGIYFVKIVDGINSFSQKIVVEN